MGDLSKNFSRSEFSCQCGCGYDTVDAELLTVLQDVAHFFEASVSVNSGCRCMSHNAKCKGSPRSQHLLGKATDIVVKGIHEDEVHQYLCVKYPEKYGIGRYRGRTHIDVRPNRSRWDNRRK